MDRFIRKKYIILCAVILFLNTTFAGNDEELFLRGNKLYGQGLYDKSLESYQAIEKKGRAVLYNMGNCYYYKGDYAQAIVCWSRAERHATIQEKLLIIQNKQQALKKIGINAVRPWYDPLLLFFYCILSYVSLFSLQLLFVLFWYLLLFVAHKNYHYKKTIISFLCIGILISLLLLAMLYIKHSTVSGVVVDKNFSLFVGPDKEFQEMGLLDVGNHVVVKEQREGWYKIQYFDKIGWVKAEAIQII